MIVLIWLSLLLFVLLCHEIGMKSEEEIRKIILKEARKVRRWALREGGLSGTLGMCLDASVRLKASLKKQGIIVKRIHGIFKVDYEAPKHESRKLADTHCDEERHVWCDWNGIPIDVTADQFNSKLLGKNRIPAIIFDSHQERFLAYNGKPFYVKK